MTDLTKVFTIQEASDWLGVSSTTLKKYCAGRVVMQKGQEAYRYAPKFLPSECRLAGKTWLITLEGLERLFGDRIKEKTVVK